MQGQHAVKAGDPTFAGGLKKNLNNSGTVPLYELSLFGTQ
jgi:hypothetical protein